MVTVDEITNYVKKNPGCTLEQLNKLHYGKKADFSGYSHIADTILYMIYRKQIMPVCYGSIQAKLYLNLKP